MAAELVASGHCRVNGNKTGKRGYGVACGDVLTFAQGDRIRVIRVTALGHRRGPAEEAVTLYHDLDPVLPEASPSALE